MESKNISAKVDDAASAPEVLTAQKVVHRARETAHTVEHRRQELADKARNEQEKQ